MIALEEIKTRFETEASQAPDLRALDDLRVRYLGKKGEVKALLKKTGSLPPEERSGWGQQVNALKGAILESIEAHKNTLEAKSAYIYLIRFSPPCSLIARTIMSEFVL